MDWCGLKVKDYPVEVSEGCLRKDKMGEKSIDRFFLKVNKVRNIFGILACFETFCSNPSHECKNHNKIWSQDPHLGFKYHSTFNGNFHCICRNKLLYSYH